MEENNKKPDCPHCNVSEETISQLRNSAQEAKNQEYESKKQRREKELAKKITSAKRKKFLFWAVIVLAAGGLVFGGIKLNGYFVKKQASEPKITVYYSTTCSCCKQYITYLRANGFNVDAEATEDVLSVKDKYNVPESAQGCHTSVIDGYVAEGMVPAGAINQMLAEKPQIDGVALPGMPDRAPGMPGYNGSALMVYSLKDGASSEFGNW